MGRARARHPGRLALGAARAVLRARVLAGRARRRLEGLRDAREEGRFHSRLRGEEGAPELLLSPHMDDAVLDCWGLLAGERDLVVVNVFAGAPARGTLAQWGRSHRRDGLRAARARAHRRGHRGARAGGAPGAQPGLSRRPVSRRGARAAPAGDRPRRRRAARGRRARARAGRHRRSPRPPADPSLRADAAESGHPREAVCGAALLRAPRLAALGRWAPRRAPSGRRCVLALRPGRGARAAAAAQRRGRAPRRCAGRSQARGDALLPQPAARGWSTGRATCSPIPRSIASRSAGS